MKLLYFDEHRHATWLELFFDLIFVVLISRVTHLLAHTHHGHLELEYVIKFPLLFIPIWVIWANHTTYSNLFDRDEKSDRFITLIIMFMMIGLAVFIDVDFDRVYYGFIIFYTSIRLILGIRYLTANNLHDHGNDHTRMTGLLMIAIAMLGLSSFVANGMVRYSIVYLSILLEFMIPVFTRSREHVDIHREHLVERIGLLTIILLGESVFSLVNTTSEIEWTIWSAAALISGFILLGSIWWILFDFFYLLEDSEKIKKSTILTIPTLFMHMGLAIIANIIRHAILNDLSLHDFKLMAFIGVLIFFLGKQIPYSYVAPKIRKNVAQNTLVVFVLTGLSILLNRSEAILIGIMITVLIYVALTFRYMVFLEVASNHIEKKKKAIKTR